MNERILELAEQCYQIEDPHGPFPREVFNQEKFAELIVRECVRLCNEIEEYDEYPESEAEACAEYILKHFGVEESEWFDEDPPC